MVKAFKTLPLNPLSWLEVGFYFMRALFFEKNAVMGYRSALMTCQEMTNLIRHIMKNLMYIIYNYIDELCPLQIMKMHVTLTICYEICCVTLV